MKKATKISIKSTACLSVGSLAIIPALVSPALNTSQDIQLESINDISTLYQQETGSVWQENNSQTTTLKTLCNNKSSQQLYNWAYQMYGFSSSQDLTHDAIKRLPDTNENKNEIVWNDFLNTDNNPAPDTNDFKSFITFFGVNGGLNHIQKLVLQDTLVNTMDNDFWASIDYYLIGLQEIEIVCTNPTNTQMRMTYIPTGLTTSTADSITIKGMDFATTDTNQPLVPLFIDNQNQPSKLAQNCQTLIIQSCGLNQNATQTLFEKSQNASLLSKLDLSYNALEQIDINLLALPSIKQLDLNNNQIKKLPTVDLNGQALNNGLDQIFLPNHNKIEFVDLSNNQLYSLINISPKEYNSTQTINDYQTAQLSHYPSLQKIDISGQKVSFDCFILGDDYTIPSIYQTSSYPGKYSDMDLNLSSIWLNPSSYDLKQQAVFDAIADKNQSSAINNQDIMANLTTTQNIMPTIYSMWSAFENNPANIYTTQNDNEYYNQVSVIDNTSVKISTKTVPTKLAQLENPEQNINPGEVLHSASFAAEYGYSVLDVPSNSLVNGISKLNENQYQIKINNDFTNTSTTSSYTYNVKVYEDQSNIFYLRDYKQNDPQYQAHLEYLAKISNTPVSKQDLVDNIDKLIYFEGTDSAWNNFISTLEVQLTDDSGVDIPNNGNTSLIPTLVWGYNDQPNQSVEIGIKYSPNVFYDDSNEEKSPTGSTLYSVSISTDVDIINNTNMTLFILAMCIIALNFLMIIPFVTRKIINKRKSKKIIQEEVDLLAANTPKTKPSDIYKPAVKQKKLSVWEKYKIKKSKGSMELISQQEKKVETVSKQQQTEKEIEQILQEME